MPPKKGGNNGVWGVIMLPFNTAAKIVFYPVQFLMWLIVDVIGRKVTTEDRQTRERKEHFRFNFLMKRPFVKKTVGNVKNFRAVLYDHFGWKKVKSPPSGWKCKNCPQPAQWLDVDAMKKYCAQCTYLLHAPGTVGEQASIEELVLKNQAHCHFITPILPEIMLVLLLYYCFGGVTFVTKDYTTSQVTCPIVNSARTMIGTIDTNILYHYKQTLFSWCDMEDSYVRFILDAWVRTIVTGSDNTILVFQTLPQALLFNLVLEYSFVPALAVLYAIALNIFYQIECRIPPNETLRKLERFSRAVNFSGFIFGEQVFDLAETKPRKRFHKDSMEWFKYTYARKIRDFKYYYHFCMVALAALAWEILLYTMLFRLACIWCTMLFRFDLSEPVRWIFSLLLPSTLETHLTWFESAKHPIVTETLLWNLSSKVLKVISGMFSIFSSISLLRNGVIAVIAITLIGAKAGFLFALMLKKEREKFDEKWKEQKKERLGLGQNYVLEFNQDYVLVKKPEATQPFEPGEAMGFEYDEDSGFVKKVDTDGPAHGMDIKKGDRMVKVIARKEVAPGPKDASTTEDGNATQTEVKDCRPEPYSKDALRRAQQGKFGYKVTFQGDGSKLGDVRC